MRNQVATWAGISAFFATLLAIGAIDVLNPNGRLQFVGGVVVGLITAGAVYAKQRLDDAKRGIDRNAGTIVVTETDDKKIFRLELGDDPDILEKQNEVTFKVKRD